MGYGIWLVQGAVAYAEESSISWLSGRLVLVDIRISKFGRLSPFV